MTAESSSLPDAENAARIALDDAALAVSGADAQKFAHDELTPHTRAYVLARDAYRAAIEARARAASSLEQRVIDSARHLEAAARVLEDAALTYQLAKLSPETAEAAAEMLDRARSTAATARLILRSDLRSLGESGVRAEAPAGSCPACGHAPHGARCSQPTGTNGVGFVCNCAAAPVEAAPLDPPRLTSVFIEDLRALADTGKSEAYPSGEPRWAVLKADANTHMFLRRVFAALQWIDGRPAVDPGAPAHPEEVRDAPTD